MTVALTDAIRLLLFPAMMAFAASSDLFTMTISNRVALALIAGFAIMAAATGRETTAQEQAGKPGTGGTSGLHRAA